MYNHMKLDQKRIICMEAYLLTCTHKHTIDDAILIDHK